MKKPASAASEPTLDDLWSAILAPQQTLDTLAPDEKTIAMLAAEYNLSEKMAGMRLLEREKRGLLASRWVRLVAGARHKVKAYRPVKQNEPPRR